MVGTTCLVYMHERAGRQLSGEHQCQVTVASSGLLHWHWGNHMIAPVWVKRSWRTWVNKSQESAEANIVTNTKYNTTKSHAFLTHCGMANLANIGSRNGLLPEGPNTLPEPKLADHQWSLVALTWGKFREQLSKNITLIWVWNYPFEITGSSFKGQWVNGISSVLSIITNAAISLTRPCRLIWYQYYKHFDIPPQKYCIFHHAITSAKCMV